MILTKKYLRKSSHKTEKIKRKIKAVDRIKQTKESLLNDIINTLNTFPENKDITPINDKCFTIKTGNLSIKSWSPKFYRFKWQYKAIIEYLHKAELGKIETTVKKIIKDKQITSTFSFGKETIKIHPEIIALLKKCI